MAISEAPAPDAKARGRGSGVEMACWAGLILVPCLGYVWLILQLFSTVGCEGVCHSELIFGTWAAAPWLLFGTAGVAVVTGLVLTALGRRSLSVAVTGLVLVVAIVVGSSLLFEAGFQPMRERNAQTVQGILPAPSPPPDPTGSWSADGRETPPSLDLAADGTLAADDGCTSFAGTWQQEPDGTIQLDFTSVADPVCDGAGVWLARAASLMVIDDRLVINGDEGTPIGVLESDR